MFGRVAASSPALAARLPRPRRLGLGAALLVLLAGPSAWAERVAGNVLDGATLEPVTGATLTAADGTKVKTDRTGAFVFEDLPAGPIEITIKAKGYDASVEAYEVAEGGAAEQVFLLFAPGFASETIEVEAETPLPPPPGRQDLPREVITRIPGARGDALSTVRSLPGVANLPGGGLIVIRGAAPEDSRILIDGIEVPIAYHFFGLQSVVPSELIANIEFVPGGFGVEEGRATGGIINIVTRDEVVAKPTGFAELSFINLAGLVQAPISKSRGLQVQAGFRRSIIDFILPAVLGPDSGVNFTTAPTYYDGQLRVDWRKSERDKLSLLGLTSSDLLSLLNNNLDPNEPDLNNATFENETSFSRAIATWTHGGPTVDNRLILSAGVQGFRFEIGDRFLRINQDIMEVRNDLTYKHGKQLRVRVGAEARYDQRELAVRFPQQPSEGMPPPTNFTTLPLVETEQTFDNSASGAYAAVDLRPDDKTTITSGVRLDHYYHVDASTWSPRLQVTRELDADWRVRLAYGRYSRGLDQAESVPTYLEPELATQLVLGADLDVADGVTATGSVFYTGRQQLVVSDPLLAETNPGETFVNRGRGRSYGVEALVRGQRQNLFGWMAYTFARSDRIDDPTGARRLFDFDQPHNFIALAAYKLGKWQFGARFQASSGTPETPITGSVYLADANVYIPQYGGVNSQRVEAAHALDLRIDRSWTWNTFKLSAFLDVTNAYAHARVLGYSYNFDYTQREPITELPILPTIGLRGTL